jgi:hypothetical protein
MTRDCLLAGRFAIIAGLAVGLAAGSAAAAGESKRELGAHEHGHGTFNVAIDGKTVAIELIAPGADIVGFEHAPTTDEQKAKLAAAKAALKKIETVLELPSAAGCKVTKADVEAPHADEKAAKDGHGHGHGHSHGKKAEKDDHGEAHSEFHATYELTCSAPDALGQLKFAYFDSFKGAEELDVTVVSPKGQKAFEATRAKPEVRLDGLV